MFSQWNGTGIRPQVDTNHAGFINSNTADSYTEGFAEFMALVIADYTPNSNDPAPSDIYASFGSLENNYKPWEKRGRMEELAVAGVLWDLYDKNNEGNDTLSIPIQQLWPVLSQKHDNFYQYTLALKAAFPDKADAIDKILLMHGFFADNFTGNGVHDAFEPFSDANGNGVYDAGEYFVDYGITANHPNILYTGKEQIGQATNYQRPNRGQAGEIPDAFIKVDDARVPFYTVSIHFANPSQGKDYSYTTEQRAGLIYLQPLPEGISATMTVTPDSQAYTSSAPFVITSAEYDKDYYAAPANQGYISKHDFALAPTGKAETAAAVSVGSAAPAWGTDAGTDMEEKSTGVIPVRKSGSGSINLGGIGSGLGGVFGFLGTVLIYLAGALVLAGYFYAGRFIYNRFIKGKETPFGKSGKDAAPKDSIQKDAKNADKPDKAEKADKSKKDPKSK